MRRLPVLTLLFLMYFPFSARAADMEDDALCVWNTMTARKSFGSEGKWASGLMIEYRHKFHGGISKTDQYFVRPSVAYTVAPWFKVQYQMDFAATSSSGFNWRFIPEVTFSHRIGDFSLVLRQRAMTTWKVAAGTNSTVLRTRAKIDYKIPETPLVVHVAAEPYWCDFSKNSFAWFQKCRWYAGFSIKLLDNLTLIPQYVCQAYHNGSGRFDRRTYDDHVIYMTFQIKL